MKTHSIFLFSMLILFTACSKDQLIDDYEQYENSENPEYIIPSFCFNNTYEPGEGETNTDCGDVCRVACDEIVTCAPMNTLILNNAEHFETQKGVYFNYFAQQSSIYFLPKYRFRFIDNPDYYFVADLTSTNDHRSNRYFEIDTYDNPYSASLGIFTNEIYYRCNYGQGFNVSEIDGKRVFDLCNLTFSSEGEEDLIVSGRLELF